MKANQILDRNAVILGAGKHKGEAINTGGVRAVGKILFTANPSADHTITVGDKTLTFKVSANASLDEVTIGADLTTTISSIITKLGTYTVGLVPTGTYTKTDTNAALTFTSKRYTAAYNGVGFPLASSNVNGTVTAAAGGVDGWLSLEHEISYITDTLATAQGWSLDVGEEWQTKTIVLGARTNAVSNVVAPLGGGVATVTFSAANQYANLICLGGKWRSLGGTAAFA